LKHENVVAHEDTTWQRPSSGAGED
jgi:hypothetical protein